MDFLLPISHEFPVPSNRRIGLVIGTEILATSIVSRRSVTECNTETTALFGLLYDVDMK
jgi:hypothetical protein